MVLEMRAKLLNGDLSCSIPIQALLASYLLQAELGDFTDIVESGGYNTFISNETLQFFPNQVRMSCFPDFEIYNKEKSLLVEIYL